MARRRSIVRTAPLLLACSIGLAACGSTTVITERANAPSTSPATQGSSPGTPTPTSTSVTGSQSSSTTGTASTGTTTTSPSIKRTTTSSSGATPPCVASMLKLGYIGGQGATGHGELAFSLTNVSSQSCHTYGYPGVQFQTSSGSPLPTNSTRTTHDFFGSAPIGALTVAPGSSVSFRLGVTHLGTSASCVSAAQLQVIPPDDTHTLVLPIPNGGAYECGGATTVTPLQSGTSAFR